jgi:hypothetical protein
MRVFSDDHRERLLIYSSMALDMMVCGREHKEKGDKDSAKKFYGISWAYNNLQEFDEGVRLCDGLLNGIGVYGEELEKLHEYGREMAQYSEDLVVAVSKVLGCDSPFKNNLPEGIF